MPRWIAGFGPDLDDIEHMYGARKGKKKFGGEDCVPCHSVHRSSSTNFFNRYSACVVDRGQHAGSAVHVTCGSLIAGKINNGIRLGPFT